MTLSIEIETLNELKRIRVLLEKLSEPVPAVGLMPETWEGLRVSASAAPTPTAPVRVDPTPIVPPLKQNSFHKPKRR